METRYFVSRSAKGAAHVVTIEEREGFFYATCSCGWTSCMVNLAYLEQVRGDHFASVPDTRMATDAERNLSITGDGEGDCDCMVCANPGFPWAKRYPEIEHNYSGNCQWRVI